ncbi:MAG: hypothetical protein E3J73_00325 [Candidatus Bathyarchaeum sp.]|nr:MAG: hypothetical protein E3J73_00325 [Candidatus Bathyarchaeum sp.]
MHKERFRKKIEELEALRLEHLLIVTKNVVEARRKGVPYEVDFPEMKERYLTALYVYDRFGLTPLELYQKRREWLWAPDEWKRPHRMETISMFLRRLKEAGLARREREGHMFRYFITESGARRLNYYANRRRTQKEIRQAQKRSNEAYTSLMLYNLLRDREREQIKMAIELAKQLAKE